jgi:hypothetical protein
MVRLTIALLALEPAAQTIGHLLLFALTNLGFGGGLWIDRVVSGVADRAALGTAGSFAANRTIRGSYNCCTLARPS